MFLFVFQAGSPQWLLFRKLRGQTDNALVSLVALRRIKFEEKRQARLAYKRALWEKKEAKRHEKFKMKIERLIAIKYGIISEEILQWDERRRIEWKVYKEMFKNDIASYRCFYKEVKKKEQEYMEKLEKERLKQEKWVYRLRSKKHREEKSDKDADDENESDDELEFHLSEFHGKLTSNTESQQRLKEKRTKRVCH